MEKGPSNEDFYSRRSAVSAPGAGVPAQARHQGRRSAQSVESGLNGLAQRIYLSGGMRVNLASVAKQRAEMEDHLKQVRESIAEIDAIGVQVKDLDSGLLDFPCRIDDEWCCCAGGWASRQSNTGTRWKPAFKGGNPSMSVSAAALEAVPELGQPTNLQDASTTQSSRIIALCADDLRAGPRAKFLPIGSALTWKTCRLSQPVTTLHRKACSRWYAWAATAASGSLR